MIYQFETEEEIVDCEHCPMAEPNVTGTCQFTHRDDYEYELGSRPSWCPLTEIKRGAENE